MPAIAESCEWYIAYDGYVPEPEPGCEECHHYFLEDYNFFKHVLEPYLHGEFADLDEARKRMFGASPLHFAEDYLDNVRVHHGMLDQEARPAQTLVLEAAIGGEPNEFHFYWNQYHGIALDAWSSEEGYYGDHIQAWLNEIGGYD